MWREEVLEALAVGCAVRAHARAQRKRQRVPRHFTLLLMLMMLLLLLFLPGVENRSSSSSSCCSCGCCCIFLNKPLAILPKPQFEPGHQRLCTTTTATCHAAFPRQLLLLLLVRVVSCAQRRQPPQTLGRGRQKLGVNSSSIDRRRSSLLLLLLQQELLLLWGLFPLLLVMVIMVLKKLFGGVCGVGVDDEEGRVVRVAATGLVDIRPERCEQLNLGMRISGAGVGVGACVREKEDVLACV